MSALIVDWLGRGGIAQCTHAMTEVLQHDSHTTVVTVAARELDGRHVVGVESGGNRLRRHRQLAVHAADEIRHRRPDVVIVQNYVIPPIERIVHQAAIDVGARLVTVVHDHRLHSPFAGTSKGLASLLERADTVVAHSNYVAERLPVAGGSDVRVLPLPVPPEYHADGEPVVTPRHGLLALHFGVLKRQYKGTDLVERLAAAGVDGWELAVVGVGAPTGVTGLTGVARFVTAGELAASVSAAHAVLLPYAHGSQSAAVSLAQARGTVPVASAVGGIPEQIEDGVTGFLVPAGAGDDEWSRVLERLRDDELRARMGDACRERSALDQAEFEAGLRDLVHA